ncbi:membrane fusion protein, multidrug efflux system [Mucilaginibacter lappiensis]|uniref:Membrane fusion protein (Multidrug efflux system) n=1 Tax=Mucilaginibacter lappiensis TaxID=354630 RepID=A0ABR6PL71_9SPHI|nr:efflux RND transporter periplasmic adaptor subunit [Mucilaginibacter lappiensis]MBB6109979.1 membrane fusion protein (multidrug efflux system) [Mucilaginibacter lappiensis]SIR56212.1 membrane fusion protein, multidrug efflux system [Mucilaginibacter lappiensis]
MENIAMLKKNTAFTMLLLLPILFTACHSGAKPGAGGPGGPTGPAPYRTAIVYAGPATMYYSYPATIQGEQDIDIRPKVDGFIEKIFVEEGAVVHKGQPLFQLRNPQYDAAVRSAMASVKIAEADVNTAEMNVEKVRPLVDKNIISDYELKSDEFTLQSKKASLASAQADLVNARVNVGYTYLTSPADGVISTIPYKVGSLITSTSTNPLTTVYNTKNIYVYFSLNEKQLLEFLRDTKGKTLKDKLATMADVSLLLADGTTYPLKGRIVMASGLIATATGSVSLRANFPNPQGLIRSGSSATIKIPVNIDNAILIPQNATYDMQGKKFVYTLSDKDSTLNTGVQLSDNPIGNLYVVRSGLKQGDKLVIEGIANLKPGMAIKPMPVNADSLYAAAKTPAADSVKSLKHK